VKNGWAGEILLASPSCHRAMLETVETTKVMRKIRTVVLPIDDTRWGGVKFHGGCR
jgi:hypothetical protein